MKSNNEVKRLFFGIEVFSPWPEKYPPGRILDNAHRHMTLAFLGNVPYQKVLDILPSFPQKHFKVGLGAFFDKCLFLPPRHPHVVAWHLNWLDDASLLINLQKEMSIWLKKNHFHVDEREFLPHVTIARSPFNIKEWKNAFAQLPCFCKDIHLYESVGNLCYEPRWSLALKEPFVEIEHTADIAYHIYGESLTQLFRHAQLALAFRYPPLIRYLNSSKSINTIEDCIMLLNEIVTTADGEIGCPFKAVSFHGNVLQEEGILKWEMIVDV